MARRTNQVHRSSQGAYGYLGVSQYLAADAADSISKGD